MTNPQPQLPQAIPDVVLAAVIAATAALVGIVVAIIRQLVRQRFEVAEARRSEWMTASASLRDRSRVYFDAWNRAFTDFSHSRHAPWPDEPFNPGADLTIIQATAPAILKAAAEALVDQTVAMWTFKSRLRQESATLLDQWIIFSSHYGAVSQKFVDTLRQISGG